MYTPENDEPEPEWVKSERHQFAEHRDLNKDGKLDRSEIGHWIHPHEYDHKELEAKHLIYESDKDRVTNFIGRSKFRMFFFFIQWG